MSFLSHDKLTATSTPQTQRADPRQVQNFAGGYSFELDPWARLDRFLVLGTQGGTYYVGEKKLTVENASIVEQLLVDHPAQTVGRIIEVSESGLAVKQDYGLFALALAASAPSNTYAGLAARKEAYDAIPRVCRTASTLEQFLSYCKGRRGWSRGLRNGIARWFDQDVGKLAYQLTKYRNRHGYSPRDILRLAHVRPESPAESALYGYAVGRDG